MKCPECGTEKARVIDTVDLGHVIWRRRLCRECEHRWWTSEMEDEPLAKFGDGHGGRKRA